jgi:serine/threonine protein kinase
VPLTPGSTFERYEIQSLIGRGGMGEVYRAVDTRLHRLVALKVLRTDKDAAAAVAEAGGVQRLMREARAAAALNHANSVAIYELGEAEGISYIAMELVTGVTFRQYLGEGHVSVETKVLWLVDAARALWAAHKAGLVHRDVKPGNIMVSEEGVVKVLDFGLAKTLAVKKDPAVFETLMGQVLGTPRYMAPEQLEGSPADAKADQYAFGLTAYELLSGTYPGGPLAGVARSLDTIVDGVSPELAQIVTKLMARHPAERFPTMEAAAHALRSCTSSVPAAMTAAAPVAKEPPLALGESRESQYPTVVQASQEEISGERAVDHGKTLPLARPMKLAIGQANHPSQAPAPSSAPKQNLNQTLPLGRPLAVSLPPGAVSGLTPTSGIYPSPAQAAAAVAMSGRASAPPSRPSLAAARTRRPRTIRAWMIVLAVAVALFAIAAGGFAAKLLR